MSGNDDDSSPDRRLVFAFYVTGHGFGHATRVVEIARHLVAAGHNVHVVTGAPEFVFTVEIQSPNLHVRKEVLDAGAVQLDALTVDPTASLELYSEKAVVPRASILAREVEWLKSINANLVVSDVVPVACRAAADAGIRSVCVTNFSWDFIYAEYVMAAGHRHRSVVWQIAGDYSHCEFVLRLPGYCPMPAFRDVIDVPLVVRGLHKSRSVVREELGIGNDVKLLIFNFGGQQAGWKLNQEWLPEGWLCLVCGASDTQELPPNFIKLSKDAYTPDLIAASDCMLGKIGYGTVSEALAYKLPFVFVRRDHFNEEPFLRNMLEHYESGVEMIRRDFFSGQWTPYLARALKLTPCYDGDLNGGEVVARILQETAVGKCPSDKENGTRRLHDAMILGYQLQRAPGRDITIPDWYTHARHEANVIPKMNGNAPLLKLQIENFEILHGEMHGLSDTKAFVRILSDLDTEVHQGKNAEKLQLREEIAASIIFNFEEVIYVSRAPGRLDVMGGIADYSGSLVLQMPIREACHVAVQRNHPSKQKMWKHALARQQAKGRGPLPLLQIVSFGSELSNRAPTFDMDLEDLMDGEQPISYEKAYDFFARDPSQKWAAYVAGTIVVLMSELGVRFMDSMSILVSSEVPEGKGVSSSASIEVSTMSAIAAAHGLDIAPRDLALLCQKVENCIVGAPCGVMDQMASACGEANKLLAMVCQPAEIKDIISIPTHIRFWGLDSGIKHSVSGADYGSVRIGTFMGRKVIKSTAFASLSSASVSEISPQNGDELNCYDYEHHGMELLKAEASLDYLCNLSTHRYDGTYARKLPENILGESFLEQYISHDDSVTMIDPKQIYAVKAPTKHPIYENFRVEAFKSLLTAEKTNGQFSALGELMYQCHYSYSECGLGSDGTDRLVELVQEMQFHRLCQGNQKNLSGAKITGGGSGGTVCIIGRNCSGSIEDVLEIQQRYKAATGHVPFLFDGSSPGAGKFGFLKLRRRPLSNMNPAE